MSIYFDTDSWTSSPPNPLTDIYELETVYTTDAYEGFEPCPNSGSYERSLIRYNIPDSARLGVYFSPNREVNFDIAESMGKFDIYEKRMISLVKVAEEVNQLDKVFTQLKDQYNSDVEYLAGNINSIMEPLLIIFIGIFVGVILVSMYLPMFQLSTGVSF